MCRKMKTRKADSKIVQNDKKLHDVHGYQNLENISFSQGKNRFWVGILHSGNSNGTPPSFLSWWDEVIVLSQDFVGHFLVCPVWASYCLMEFRFIGFPTLGIHLWNFIASFLISEKISQIFPCVWCHYRQSFDIPLQFMILEFFWAEFWLQIHRQPNHR